MSDSEYEMSLHIKAARESIKEALAWAGSDAIDAWKPNLRAADEALKDIEERLAE